MSIDQNRVFRLCEQTVVLDDFPAVGWVLDIGGGGEAVIGQLKGAQVVAIDLLPRELESLLMAHSRSSWMPGSSSSSTVRSTRSQLSLALCLSSRTTMERCCGKFSGY